MSTKKRVVKSNKKLIESYINNPEQFLLNNDLDIIIDIYSYASDKYYNDESILSDKLFDQLKEYIELVDPKNPILEEVGFRTKINKVKLPFFMGSMDKIKPDNSKALLNYINDYHKPYIYSDKLDGVSGLIYKKDNQLYLYKRGTGVEGSDISKLLDYINISDNITKSRLLDVLNKLDIKDEIAIRGELVMKKEVFDKKYSKLYENARNLVSGATINKKLNKELLKDIDFVAYELVSPWFDDMSKQFKFLEQLKLNVVHYDKIINDLDFNDLRTKLIDRKKNSLYEVDGIIISSNKIDNIRSKEKYPPYAFAFKDTELSEVREVKVLDVEWNVSKDGYIKPILILEPVFLNGVTISRVTANNAKFIVDNKIGKNTIIKLIRSGDVIPKIVGIVKHTTALLPDLKYKWNETKVDILIDEEHDQQIISELVFFFEKLKIKYVSEGTVKKLVDIGIDDIIKVFDITKKQLLEAEGIEEKSAEKIYNNIKEAIDNLTILELMVASNSFGHGIGERKIIKVLEKHPDILNLYEKLDENELIDILINLESFDEITATNFVKGLDKFIDIFNELKPSLRKQLRLSLNDYKKKLEKIKNLDHKIKDKKVIFSGFRNEDLENKIKDNGGKIVSSVSKNTDILITTDNAIKAKSNSKVVKALELKIEILTEDEFIKKYF
jgi:DNA ligase (NAD+)